MVYESADLDANIIFGAVIDESLKDEVRVTIIATGFVDEQDASGARAAAGELRSSSGMSLRTKLESIMSREEEKVAEGAPAGSASPDAGQEAETAAEEKSVRQPAAAGAGGELDDLETPAFIRRQPGETDN